MSWVIATPYMYSSRKYLSNEGNEGGVGSQCSPAPNQLKNGLRSLCKSKKQIQQQNLSEGIFRLRSQEEPFLLVDLVVELLFLFVAVLSRRFLDPVASQPFDSAEALLRSPVLLGEASWDPQGASVQQEEQRLRWASQAQQTPSASSLCSSQETR